MAYLWVWDENCFNEFFEMTQPQRQKDRWFLHVLEQHRYGREDHGHIVPCTVCLHYIQGIWLPDLDVPMCGKQERKRIADAVKMRRALDHSEWQWYARTVRRSGNVCLVCVSPGIIARKTHERSLRTRAIYPPVQHAEVQCTAAAEYPFSNVQTQASAMGEGLRLANGEGRRGPFAIRPGTLTAYLASEVREGHRWHYGVC